MAMWSDIEKYFIHKYKLDNNVDTCPFKLRHIQKSAGPGPQQPRGSNDCAIYCLYNMIWYSFNLHEHMTDQDYSSYMSKASNNNVLRTRALKILVEGVVFY